MTTYQGPHAGIANGNPFLAKQVENSFDRLAESVNAVDGTNFPTDNTLTYRSVHPGALTQTFGGKQVIYEEPACWVVMGRGGTDKTTDFSLGERENLYTVDGCSVRVVVGSNGVVKVNSMIQIESIKLASFVDAGSPVVSQELFTADLDVEFKLKIIRGDEPRSSASTVDSVRRRLTARSSSVPASPALNYDRAKGFRRGFSVSLGGDVAVSDANPNGSSYDFFVTMEVSIDAVWCGVPTSSNRVISDTDYDGILFLAHLRSRSRYTSARFFLE